MADEQTTEQLRDHAVAAEMSATEDRREVKRLRALLEERAAQLVQVTIERDEFRRERDQVLDAERAVRRLVLRAGIDGEVYLPVADVRAVLDVGGDLAT